ncbi:uncharacterized protein LOC108598200 [Drosophila busckii]|nr:uncharacterized protein LOC108598200 [Drosophila busckii]
MLAEYKSIAPVEQQMQSKNCRQTLLLAEPIEEECNTNINLNHVEPRKSRQTLLLTEPIEEDIAKSEAQSSQQKHTSLFSNISFEDCFRSTPNEEEELQPQVSIKQLKRQTFAENKTIAPPEQQMQPKSARQTLLLAEPIEEERTTDLNLKEKQLIDEPKKSRQTLLLTEPIEEDITKSEPKSSQQKETAIFSNISFEDCFRSTPNEEEEVSIKQVKRHTLVENKTIAPPEQQMQPKYSRQTLLLTEPIEEERNTNLNLHHDEPRKSRQTLLLAEPIEEDFNLLQIKQEMIKKPCTEPIEEERNTNLNLKHNEPRKSRQTLLLAEPMEEDLNLLQNEPEIMEKPQRSRQTLLSTEAIEEEPNANLSFEHEQMKVTDEPRVSRQTMLLTEPIKEDLQTMVDNLQKTRQTLHEYNAIEMGFSVLQDVNMPLEDKKKKSRVTLLHNEPIHEEVISTQQDSMAKFEASQQTQRATMFGKTINVDSSHLSSESMPSGVSSSMETQEIQTKEPELTAKQISARKTQHQVEPMEEDSYYLPEYKITRKTYFANAPIELDDSPKPEANNKSVKKQLPTTNKLRESLLRQTCIEIDDSDTQSRTPVRKPISNFFPITPGMSMTEFEGYEAAFDESHSKALPMETSSCDTPVSRPRQSVNIKRLPTHLTPNLPEAKKRSSKQPLPSQLQLADDNTLQFELKPGTASTELDGTVQMIRAAAVPRKSLFEDGPITISDVADHFAAQANNNSGTSRSSTDCTAHDKFVNLGGDTVIFSAENTLALDSPEEDIDKTRFSLVSSMEEEQEHTTAEASSHSFVMEAESCLELQSMPNEPGAVAVVCKKCTNCRRTIEANETIKMVNYKFDFGLDEIRRLEQRRRNLQNHVENYWEMKYLEIQNTNVQHETTADLNSTAGVGNKTLSKQQKLQMFLDMLQPQPFVPVLSFAKRLDAAIEQQAPNWIFDHQRACDRVYFFSHTKLSTFRLLVKYEPLSYEEIDIKVRSIEALTCSLVPQERWSVYEHFEDFELRLKLPLNLCQLLDSSDVEGFIKLLQHIDNAAAQVKLLSKQLFSTLFSMHASLIREPNRNIVRKTISKFVMGEEMEIMSNVLTDYKIEIGNLAETSFKNIIQPPLHQLDEKIQFLPKGIEFLKEFLKTPEDFIKPGEIVPSYLAD